MVDQRVTDQAWPVRLRQIDLLPDSVFYPRAIRRQAGDSTVRDDIGRWTLEAGARLHTAAARCRPSQPFGASVVRKLDAGGRAMVSGLG
jgi:hypothetical protein